MIDILLDGLLDTIKLMPFLFVSFIIMEYIEHKLTNIEKLNKINKYGALGGSLLGVIPQCGMAALGSNLYAARVITLGSLFSIYLSTSDEMLPILIANKTGYKEILIILGLKVLLGFVFGFIVDLFLRRKIDNNIKEICDKEECHCNENIFISSLIHTIRISMYILVINIILNIIIDDDIVSSLIVSNKIFAPIISSIIGIIPNCASSIMITELYIEGIITLGSCIAGLLCGTGVGIVILFKQNKNIKENIFILLSLILYSSLCGIVINYII